MAPSSGELVGQPVLSPELHDDAAEIERLVLSAFGPGRYAKAAERLREQNRPLAGWVARLEGRAVASVRLWLVKIGNHQAGLLGPIAVEEAWRHTGFGAQLVTAVIEGAQDKGLAGVLLVGDQPYFGRFGFKVAKDICLPGPVDPQRVLWLGFGGEAISGTASAAGWRS